MTTKSKFCILAGQRTGSTWLKSLLDSHSQITALGELFICASNSRGDTGEVISPFYIYKKGKKSKPRPFMVFEYLDSLNNYYDEDCKVIGFKLMYNQIKKYPEVILRILLNKYCIVHLVRKNYLDILISDIAANQYNLFHVKHNQAQAKIVTLETFSLLKKMNYYKIRYQISKILLNLLPIPVIEINYESLVSNRNETLNTLTDFLQVDRVSVPLNSNQKKVNPGSYQDKISNYYEVLETLKNSEYARFLKE